MVSAAHEPKGGLLERSTEICEHRKDKGANPVRHLGVNAARLSSGDLGLVSSNGTFEVIR